MFLKRFPLWGLCIAASTALFVGSGSVAHGQQYWNTNGVAAPINAANYSATQGGPFSTAYAPNTEIIFGANSAVTYVTLTDVGNVTVLDGFNVFLNQAGTYTTGGQVRTLNIGTGSVFDLSNQAISIAAGTGFIKNGSGILFTSNGNLYLGGFTLNAGTIIIGGINAMGGGALNLIGGSLTANADRVIPVAKYTAINLNGNVTLGGVTTGVRSGNALSAANISFADAVTLGALNSKLTIGGVGTYTFSGAFNGTTGLIVDATSGGNLILSGTNAFSGGITVNSGSLILAPTALNTYAGNTTVNGGVLTFLNTNAKPTSDFTTVGSGGTVALGIGTGAYTTSDVDALNANTFTNVSLDSASGIGISTVLPLTYSTSITGARSFAKLGVGALTLTGTNSYTGRTLLYAGAFILNNPETATEGPFGAPSTTPGSIVLNGGFIRYTSAFFADYSSRFSTASEQRYNIETNGQNVTWATALTSTLGSVSKGLAAGPNVNNLGTLRLTGANTYTGPTSVFGGLLIIDNPATVIGSTTVAPAMILNGGVLNGVGALHLVNGTINLGGISSGAPQLIIGLAGATTASYGFLNIVNGIINYSTEGLPLVGATTNSSRFGPRRGAIYQTGGAMNFTYIGPGNTVTPAINGNAAEMIIGAGGERAIVYSTGGTVNISTGIQTGFSLTVGDTLIAAGNGGTGGGSDLTIAGTANWTMTGAAAFVQITRNTAVSAGTLNLNGGGQLTTRGIVKGSTFANSIARINFDGGTLRAGAPNIDFLESNPTLGITSTRIYAGGATFDTPTGNNITIASVLSAPTGQVVSSIPVLTGGSGYVGPPILLISGTGTGASAVANMTYDPTTGLGSVSSITITSPGSGYTGTPTVSISFGFQSTGTAATLGPVVTTAAPTTGGVTKTGPATLTLSAVNTYTGSTLVNGGTLLIASPGSISTGAVIVGGALAIGTPILGGTGTINGAVTLASASGGVAGTLSPGVTTGTLTVANNVTFQNGSTFKWDIAAATPIGNTAPVTNGSSDIGVTKDLLVITGGTITVTASSVPVTFNLTQIGTVTLSNANYYSFTVATSTGTPDISGFVPLTSSGLLANAPDFSAYVTAGGTVELNSPGDGNVYLNLTPVPEPGTILGLGVAVLGFGRWMRRRRNA